MYYCVAYELVKMEVPKTIKINLNLDELNHARATHFFEIYDHETTIGDSKTKYYLGNRKPRICRFCKKSEPKVIFKSDAHVIPQFMGNRNLLSYFECDTCNSLFGKYEDSFANFFGITRTFAQIPSQSNKIPKFNDKKTGLEVFLGDTAIQITTIEGNDVLKIDKENKSIEIITERPGYIPIHIPKTIIKMGLSMLSDTDIINYDVARKFIIQTKNDIAFKDNNLLKIYGYFIPGPPKYPKPFVQLFKKKDNIKILCPERQILVYYSNYCFQMVLPFAKSDNNLDGQKINLPIAPLLIDYSYFEQFGEYQKIYLNLTSNEKKSGEEHIITFSYDNIKQTL